MYDIPVEPRFMADKEQSAAVLIERLFQRFFGIRIQMVGRFVQHQYIRLFVEQLTQPHFCLLSTA